MQFSVEPGFSPGSYNSESQGQDGKETKTGVRWWYKPCQGGMGVQAEGHGWGGGKGKDQIQNGNLGGGLRVGWGYRHRIQHGMEVQTEGLGRIGG